MSRKQKKQLSEVSNEQKTEKKWLSEGSDEQKTEKTAFRAWPKAKKWRKMRFGHGRN